MPSELPAENPSEWLRHARSHLALAQVDPPPEVLRELFCFHAHEAAEKALKAILTAGNIPPPSTHNIRSLLELIPEEYPPEVEEAAALAAYAVPSRQPGDRDPVDECEYRKALKVARAAVDWAGEIVEEGMKKE